MNLYRFNYVAEHGAEYECELYARSWEHAHELFREDFGSLRVVSVDLIDEDDGEDSEYDGQPTMYEEYQDLYGGDDQFETCNYYGEE